MSRLLSGLGYPPYSEGKELSENWAAGDKGARKKVDAILVKAGLTIDEVTAETVASELHSFERLDQILASAEARRNNALREIDRHREAASAALRRAVDEVEDAVFRDVETGEINGPAS